MRFIELAIIASPELTSEGQEELIAKIDALLKKKRKKAEKGEILNVSDWGVRKLSYPIQKQSKGHYFFITIQCCPDTLIELERNLKLDDDILRYQSIRLKKEPNFDAAAAEPVAEEGGETMEKTEAGEETVTPAGEGSADAAQLQS